MLRSGDVPGHCVCVSFIWINIIQLCFAKHYPSTFQGANTFTIFYIPAYLYSGEQKHSGANPGDRT